MTNEQLNTALKDICRTGNSLGMVAFQHLEEILNHTYEYTCREDILLSIEYHDLLDA